MMKTCVICIVTLCIAYSGAQTVILGPESFEDLPFPPSGWQVFGFNVCDSVWDRHYYGDLAPDGVWVAGIQPDPVYVQDEFLQTASFDLSEYDLCDFVFEMCQSEVNDYLYIYVSLDGGGTGGSWSEVAVFYQTGPGWHCETLWLDDFCGYSNVVVGFDYYTPYSNNAPLYLDLVTVIGYQTGIEERGVSIETSNPELSLYPNPASGKVAINYSLSLASEVSIKIYDIKGTVVKDMPSGRMKAGNHTTSWDGRGNDGIKLPAGVYFCRMNAGSANASVKLTLIRNGN